MRAKVTFTLCFCFILQIVSLPHSFAVENTKSRFNKLFNQSTVKLTHSCQQKVIHSFKQIAKKNQYRLLNHSTKDSQQLQLFVLLIYNDQSTHLNLNIDVHNCEINTIESFEITAPCPEVRESLFKRFNIIGRLSKTTLALRLDSPRREEDLIFPKSARPIAFLTQNLNGKGCFVTKKQSNHQPKNAK